MKKMRIGMAVVVIPFNHPLRTASDFALIDVLSHGRLDMGVGRAYQPHEFAGLGVPMDKSREMFNEGLDIVLKAWTEEKITYKGKFWTIPEPVEVLPKPVQKPHPPIYQATISPESFEQAARLGANLQFASPFTYRTYREAWMDELEKHCQHYEKQCVGAGPRSEEGRAHDPAARSSCTRTSSARKEIYAPHVEWFYDKVTSHQLAAPTQGGVVKGYELTMSEGKTHPRDGLSQLRQAAPVRRRHCR